MFSLIQGFYQWITSREEVKILMIGLQRSGKTSILEQLKGLYNKKYHTVPLSSIPPTLGMNLGKLIINSLDVTIWDIGGSMLGIWDQYYGSTDVILFVVEASDRDRFDEVASTLDIVVQQAEKYGIPIVVCANKSDKSGSARIQEVIDSVCRPATLVDNPSFPGFRVFSTSAVTKEGISEAVEYGISLARVRTEDHSKK